MASTQRFPARLPVAYRTIGDTGWHRGHTSSISASGAFIECDAPPASSEIIVTIDLPYSEGCLIGRARVVRNGAGPHAGCMVAVRRFRTEPRPSTRLRVA
jgi:hypothetical protein